MSNILNAKELKNYKVYKKIISEKIDKYRLAVNVVKNFLDKYSDSYIIYENKYKDEISIGIGEYLEFFVFSDKIQILKNKNIEEFVVSNLSSDIFNIFKKVDMNEWKAYGIANFSYAKNSFLDTKVDEKLMELFIPNIDITIVENTIFIKYIEKFEFIVSMVEDCLSNLKEVKEIITENDKSKLEFIKSVDENYYKNIVSKATEEIKDGFYEKVILSRKINLGKRISFMDSYLEGRITIQLDHIV